MALPYSEDALAIARHFGRNLARIRKEAGLTQEAAASRAGLHRTEIGRLESSTGLPRVDTLAKLSAALDVSPNELMKGIEWLPGDQGGCFRSPK